MAFTVRWIIHKRDIDTVKTEYADTPDLDQLVRECKFRLGEIRHLHPARQPNGIQIVNEDGTILRQWISSED